MRIYLNLNPQYCEKTGTSKKLTDAILKDSSTVKTLVNSLKFVSNSVCGDRLKFQSQCDKLIELTSTDNVNAKELQMYARATKQIFRDSYKDICLSLNSTGGRIHSGSDADRQIRTAYKAYQIAKAIQHNDSSILHPN